jgi:transposase
MASGPRTCPAPSPSAEPAKLTVAEAARRLGISENLLHTWKKAIAKGGPNAFPGSGHITPLEEENRWLRAEVKRLEAERDILKKLCRQA